MSLKKNGKDEVHLLRNSTMEFLIFTGQTDEQSIEARYENETVWLSQKLVEKLFSISVLTFNEFAKNTYALGELLKKAPMRTFRIVQSEGGGSASRNEVFYSLDAIISVGYRANSVRQPHFGNRLPML